MIRAMRTAASGMMAQQTQVDTIANNIANVNTASFKKNRVNFRSLLYTTLREPGATSIANQQVPTGLQIGTGTEVSSSIKLFLQGDIEQTGNPIDIAIQGDGFFKIAMGNGEFRYTRDGSFKKDGSNSLVTSEGYPLDPPVQIPPDAITTIIAEDGSISVLKSESGLPEALTNISLFRFSNSSGLKAQGGNLYSETPSSGQAQQATAGADGTGLIKQGYLERSNVQVVDELVSLILAQRNYEINSRAIRVSDEMLQQVNNMIR